MLNKGAYLRALSSHVKDEPLPKTFFGERKADLEYLLNAAYNAFKGAYKRSGMILRGLAAGVLIGAFIGLLAAILVACGF